jgi:flagellar biosynthesis protein FlhG
MPGVGGADQAAGLRRTAERRQWSVAVTSGKGGVGKTSLAVNLALSLAQAGRRTCLVDGDLGLANVDVLLNLHPRHSLREVLVEGRPMAEIVMEGPAGLLVIPAASGVEALGQLSPARRRALHQQLTALGPLADMLVLDTGAGLSPTVLTLALAADEVLVVTTPDPTALTDAYAMIKILTQRRPALPLRLVVNQVEHAEQARDVHGHLDRIARRFLQREVPMAGWVPRDACVERAVREQRPLVLYFPYARASEAVRRLAEGLGRPSGPGGEFWGRLLATEEAA